MKTKNTIIVTAALVALFALAVLPAHAQDVAWVRQFDSAGFDSRHDVAVDSFGNIYVAGVMRGWPAR